jgi:thiol-disulfide isomerase/thioredoxin
MRALLALIICLAFLSSQAQHRSFFNLDHPNTLEGKIRNYKQREDNRFFKVRTFDVQGRIKDTSVEIKPDGSFYVRYLAPGATNIMIQYAGTFVHLLQYIGNKSTLEIDDKVWMANENKAPAIKSIDEMSRISAIVIDFRYHLRNQVLKTPIDWQDKSKADEELVNIRLQRLKEQLEYLEKYTREKDVRDNLFKEWTKYDMIFEAGWEIAFTLFTSSRHRSYTIDQLFTLLKKFPVDSMSSAMTSNFYSFADMFTGALLISHNINPGYEALRKQPDHNVVQFLLDKMDSVDKSSSTDIWYKLLYYNLYVSLSPAKTAFYETRFYGKTRDDLLNEKMDQFRVQFQQPFTEFDLLTKLKSYNVDASLKERLIKLLESRKDSYVFMDFWGTWCGPCMSEMPHYAEFIKRLKDKNITFFFMGVNTPETEALKVKKKYKIDGNFITLTESEEAILQNILSIKGYPTHVLLKPGLIVTGYTGENISWGQNFNTYSVKKIESYLTATQ